jgi:hypothetical protein
MKSIKMVTFSSLAYILTVFLILNPVSSVSPPSAVSDNSSALPQRLIPIGQVGGDVQDVAIRDNLGYVGIGPRLAIFDLSHPDNPLLLGQSRPLPGIIQDVEVDGSFAYVTTCGYGDPSLLIVLDVYDPDEIRTLGSITFTGCSKVSYIAQAGYVYRPYNDAILVIDVRNPLQPKLINSIDVAVGSITDIARVGTRLYLPTTGSELPVVDISNPEAPALLAPLPAYWEHRSDVRVAVYQSYLYAIDMKNLYVYDIHDPNAPILVGSASLFTYARDITAASDHVAVIEKWYKQGVAIVDVQDKSNPVVAGYLDMEFGGEKVEGAGAQVFIADSVGGFRIVDVQDVQNPYEVGSYMTVPELWNLVVKDGFAYAGDQSGAFSVLDIQNDVHRQIGLYQKYPQTDQETYTCPNGTWLFGDVTLYDLSVSGNYAYAAGGVNGLQVFSLADPYNPTIVGSLDTAGSAFGVAVSGNQAYLADYCYGLRVIDIQDPFHPVEMGSYGGIQAAMSVAIADHYAYVADRYSGLFVLDIQDPALPVKVLEIPGPGAWDIVVMGQYLYLPSQTFQIYDLSNPAAPALLGELAEFGYYTAVDGENAYLTSQSRVKVIDIRNPRHPVLVERKPTPGLARGIAAEQGKVYIADDDGGFYELQSTDKVYFLPLFYRQ